MIASGTHIARGIVNTPAATPSAILAGKNSAA
jgi:hypothetical protein